MSGFFAAQKEKGYQMKKTNLLLSLGSAAALAMMTTVGCSSDKAAEGSEAAASEGSCGADKKAEGSCGADKKAEGSCGADKKADSDKKEHSCGEGSCGGN